MGTSPSLVTGGTGFVGTALVKRLLADGERVRVLALAGDPLREALRSEAGPEAELEIVSGDLTDEQSVSAACDGVKYVYHAAALVSAADSYHAFERINVGGTENVCRACLKSGVERLVVVSTSDVFGLPRADEVLTEESPYRRWNEPYADTKIAAARRVAHYRREHGLSATIIYPGWVYGPGDRAFLPAVVDLVRDGSAYVWGRGRDFEVGFIYIDDLVEGIMLAARSRQADGQGFLILDDSSGVTPPDFYRIVAERLGCPIRIRTLPFSLMYGVAWASQRLYALGLVKTPLLRTMDVKSFGYNFRFSSAKARTVLGWGATTSFEEGIAPALEWFHAHAGELID